MQLIFYALGLMDWFVPIAADFKKVQHEAQEENLYEDMTEDKTQDFMDEIIKYMQEQKEKQ